MKRSHRLFEWPVLALAAALLAWLLLAPPFTGMADNADFAKVIGRFCYWPASGGANNFLYFEPSYRFDPGRCWRSDVISAEIALAAVPVAVARLRGPEATLDIRWLGALHALLLLAALALALRATRKWPFRLRTLSAALLLLIWFDVCYTAYFNSFYSDAAAINGFLLMASAAAWLMAEDRPNPVGAGWFTFGAILFAGSKAQHAMFGPLAAAFLVWILWRRKPMALVAATLVLTVSAASFALTPRWYTGQALFNAIFFRILPESPQPTRTLDELSLDASYLPYAGMHAFMPASPAQSNDWAAALALRTGHRTLAAFYLRHPLLALRHMDLALRKEAPVLRPVNLSNFRQVDGHPAGARTTRLSLWSWCRAGVLDAAPRACAGLLVCIWVALGVAAWKGRRTLSGRLSLAAAVILTVAFTEFTVAALADACETYRHLLLTHLMIDTALLLGAAAAATRFIAVRQPYPNQDTRMPAITWE